MFRKSMLAAAAVAAVGTAALAPSAASAHWHGWHGTYSSYAHPYWGAYPPRPVYSYRHFHGPRYRHGGWNGWPYASWRYRFYSYY
jgi:hypothetical protein